MDTTRTLFSVLSEPDLLLELEPEELGGLILSYANAASYADREGILYKGFKYLIDLGDVPVEKRTDVSSALGEAWQWLEREGLVIPRPHSKGFMVTRRGQRLRSQADVGAYVASRALPRTLLHPRLVQRVWSAVIRGDYDSAVFQAFREIEIAVRDASGLLDTEVGVPLMRRAFDKASGPLALQNEPEGEREALAHLFAGAIGRFKNPSSHRSVEYTLSDAAEALMLASLLLGIVDERRALREQPANQRLEPTAGTSTI